MSHIDFSFSAADIWPCIDDFVARLIKAEGGDPAAPTREQLEAVERYLIDWMAKLQREKDAVMAKTPGVEKPKLMATGTVRSAATGRPVARFVAVPKVKAPPKGKSKGRS